MEVARHPTPTVARLALQIRRDYDELANRRIVCPASVALVPAELVSMIKPFFEGCGGCSCCGYCIGFVGSVSLTARL
jgi:hypothetical protein